jgi:hypothetical protein
MLALSFNASAALSLRNVGVTKSPRRRKMKRKPAKTWRTGKKNFKNCWLIKKKMLRRRSKLLKMRIRKEGKKKKHLMSKLTNSNRKCDQRSLKRSNLA